MKRSMTLALSVAAVLGVNNLYADTIFCVDDQALNDSQFCKSETNFAEDTPTPALTTLGPLHQDCDIEALDVVYDPGDIYAASGDDTPRPGHLYRLDRAGPLDDLGGVYYVKDGENIKLNEIDGISADPDDGVIWGWSQGQGLFKIKPDDASLILPIQENVGNCTALPDDDFVVEAEMVIPTSDPIEIEDIEWNEDGEVLYGVENVHTDSVDSHGPPDYEDGIKLWAYYQDTNTIEAVCTLSFDLPVATSSSVLPSAIPVLEGEIEGLDSLPRSFFDLDQDTDALILTFHDRTSLSFAVITTPQPGDTTCGIESYGTLADNPFSDIEGIAYGPTTIDY